MTKCNQEPAKISGTVTPYATSSLKRSLDISISLITLFMALPVLMMSGLWIKMVSPGPVLFRQQRVGYLQKPFSILKMRTMHLGVESDLGNVTIAHDPRFFRGANFLRALKIDELPQVFNILKGDMSLVGPRPTTEDDYRKMTPWQCQRSLTTPGLTGLAQISGNTSLNWHQRIDYDLQYLDKASLIFDIKILTLTAIMVVFRKIETHPPSHDEWGETFDD